MLQRAKGLTRTLTLAVGLALALAGAPPLTTARADVAQEAIRDTLALQIAVEQGLLARERERYRDARADSDAAERRLDEALRNLDTAVGQQPGAAVDKARLESLRRDVSIAIQARDEALERLQAIVDSIGEIADRVAALQATLEDLRKTMSVEDEPLTGTWDVALLPSGDRGVFTLRQGGTLVSGQYTLQGGWRGSLQGTIVDGKVLLQRIDSKLGRVGEFEGYLEGGRRLIRGRWQNYSLAAGSVAAGSWTATLRSE